MASTPNAPLPQRGFGRAGRLSSGPRQLPTIEAEAGYAMMRASSPSASLAIRAAAIACALAASIVAGLGQVAVAVLLALASAWILFAEAWGERRRLAIPAALLRRLRERAEAGRRLVIYERETGLLAQWYVALRGQEECDRARRYRRDLSLLVVEPADPESAWAVKDELVRWMSGHVRASDIAGYFGNGRFVLIMPEASRDAVARVIERLCGDVSAIVTGVSAFPGDGETYDALYRSAADALRQRPGSAAAA